VITVNATSPENTGADIVRDTSSRARNFENLGIDYYCGAASLRLARAWWQLDSFEIELRNWRPAKVVGQGAGPLQCQFERFQL
jgi:hypothetical protein